MREERYTADEVRAEVEKDRVRLFADYGAGRSPTWACDPRTKDLICIGNWIVEQLVALGCNEADRRTQMHFYNRWARSDDDLFDLAARALNAVLDGDVEQNRVPHRRWG
jgi:hypothetical protein